ncbi:hypothetical protein CTI14_15485 [Methylobacterium radiotolerans]|nr:hypothetical protein CTI14_15485 [Methylobacterium radiotolerans]
MAVGTPGEQAESGEADQRAVVKACISPGSTRSRGPSARSTATVRTWGTRVLIRSRVAVAAASRCQWP